MRLLVIALLAGCSGSVNKCKDGTLFLAITLDAPSQAADTLVVDVSIDGDTPKESTLAHQAGTGMGGLQIEFPKGYPNGKLVMVEVVALSGGDTVGHGSFSQMLTAGCSSGMLPVMGASPDDLAGADLTGFVPDLSESGDLAEVVDLLTPDLTQFVDLIGCVPQTEDCFNNLDDDCDGKIDCADPDCVGGGTPIAACVPDSPATTGILLAGMVTCPTAYPSPKPLGSNFADGTCTAGTCSCSSTVPGESCTAFLGEYGSDSTCMSNQVSLAFPFSNVNGGCAAIAPSSSSKYHLLQTPSWTYSNPACAAPTGLATKVNAAFNGKDTFCSGAQAGGGCAPGNHCAPAAANYCVMKPGNQVACPSGYTVKRSTRYFGTINDGRVCSCTCTLTSNGSCGSSSLDVFTSSDCSGSSFPFLLGTSCATGDLSLYGSLKVGPPTTSGSCSFSLNNSGTATPTDEQTVCCQL